MRDDPRRNLKWLEQELLAEDEVFHSFDGSPEMDYEDGEDLLELVDMLLEDEAEETEWEPEEEPPIRNFANNYGRTSKGERAERAHAAKHQDESVFVPVKTKKQLRREAKLQKREEKKAGINRNLKGLTVLAILECIGILAIIGWWLQWLI